MAIKFSQISKKNKSSPLDGFYSLIHSKYKKYKQAVIVLVILLSLSVAFNIHLYYINYIK